MRPYQTFHVLEVLRHSVSAPLRRGGVVLSDDDRETTLDVYFQWILLCVDLNYLQPEALLRDARRLWSSMLQEDVLSLNNVFAECLHSIRVQNAKGFKGLCKRISPHLFRLIEKDFEGVLRSDVLCAKRLIQLFSFTSRLSLKNIDLTQQMLESYMEIEENIPQSYPLALVHSLNGILRQWLGSYLPADIVPHHGPGGVAKLGRCDILDKYLDLATDQLLEYSFGQPWWVDSTDRNVLDRTSSTIFVPKSYKTFRTISMEPTTLQYFQQGVWDVIDQYVWRHHYLRNHIGFHDATRNRALAKTGSIFRNYATVDLSSASDSVGYELVKQLFRGTWLLRYIVTTRSTHTQLPDGRVVALKKFAPMGSSLCFPIETLIFAAICEHVTRAHRVFGDYSVYGDDIIVPTQCVGLLYRVLTNLGFIVNTSKSFAAEDCWFRESCGGEFCNGYDVTPIRVSRKYSHADDTVRAMKWYDLANSAYERNFRCLRYFYLKKILSTSLVPYFAPTELVSDNYTNYQARHRWNRSLQRSEVYTSVFTSKKVGPDPLEYESYRLRHWLESTCSREFVREPFVSTIRRTTMITKRAWRVDPEYPLDQRYSESLTKTP